MASATVLCPNCDKHEGIVPCLGCRQTFCVKHFQIHRQNLFGQLEDVVTRRNTLQEDYYSTIIQTFDPNKFELRTNIDQWEEQMHDEIRKTADRLRQQFDQHVQQSREKVERELQQMTENIQEKMERENFMEEDIEKLTNHIDRMEDDLKNNRYHPQIEFNAQPVDFSTSVQLKLIENDQLKVEKLPATPTPPVPASPVTSKPKYPPSLQRKCYTCGTDTWQKECKCCSQVYCGWHLKRHATEGKKH